MDAALAQQHERQVSLSATGQLSTRHLRLLAGIAVVRGFILRALQQDPVIRDHGPTGFEALAKL
jgi:hypothetical protein